MYAIIYFLGDWCGVVHNPKNDYLRLFKTLKEADKYANKKEKSSDIEYRVISIDSVHE